MAASSAPNVPHAFWNAADEPARILEVITPAGFEGYSARLGELLRGGSPPDLGAIAVLAAENGMAVDPASTPALMAEHDLRLPRGTSRAERQILSSHIANTVLGRSGQQGGFASTRAASGRPPPRPAAWRTRDGTRD